MNSTVKPYSWQEPHIEHLIDCFTKYPYVLDASDTGCGKTFTSLFACKKLGQKPLVIAPKIVLSAWREAAKAVGVELFDVLNIEKAKGSKYQPLERLIDSRVGRKKVSNWKWHVPPGTLVIWDEVQNAGGEYSQNGRALMALKEAKLPALCMSATIADDPMRLRAIGYLLGLHGYGNFRTFCVKHECVLDPFAGGYALMFTKNAKRAEKALLKIHADIFPEKGGRLKIADIKDFPDNAIFADAYDLPDKDQVQAVYDELEEKLHDGDDEIAIVAQLRARQNVELLKTPIFVQLTLEGIAEGRSMALFVSFRDTMDALITQLYVKGVSCSIIEGGQKEDERDREIEAFQSNRKHVIIVMIQAGGVGVSLHDLHGRPRESLISPPYSANNLKQVLGRIHRAGSKSKSVQKIVFVAGTVEEDACKSVRRKLNNLSTLVDGDLGTGAGF